MIPATFFVYLIARSEARTRRTTPTAIGEKSGAAKKNPAMNGHHAAGKSKLRPPLKTAKKPMANGNAARHKTNR